MSVSRTGLATLVSNLPQRSALIGIGGTVARSPPSRPEELHLGPLTEPDVSLSTYHGSCHPSKTAAFRRDQRVLSVARCPSARIFAPRFLQTPPHGDALALRYPSPPSGWGRTCTR